MTRLMAAIIGLMAVSGCAAIKNANRVADAGHVALPDEMKQPRLWELLTFLSENGIESATDTSLFEFTDWPMYAHPDWADEPRKPRYEGATVRHADRAIIFAISPIEPVISNDPASIYMIETFDPRNEMPTGASFFLPGCTWSIAFTMDEPDDQLQGRLTALMTGFIDQFKARPRE